MEIENQVSSSEVKAYEVCKGLMSEQRTEQEVTIYCRAIIGLS
ncbi:unnamed protein product [Arabidopsis thaliana]|uniref:Uncharacterized protein n=1 Tax=Arabidopsis thaliana TaxID=3702 RepID=A0A5S9XIK3_ARATH|nr:unnamed protein product [Arabidopsis thaliana]